MKALSALFVLLLLHTASWAAESPGKAAVAEKGPESSGQQQQGQQQQSQQQQQQQQVMR